MIEKGIGPEEQKKIVEAIVDRQSTWKQARKEKEEIWDDVIKHYLVYVDEGKYDDWPWRCKVARPTIQEIIDTVSASVKAALFPDNEEFFQVEGLDEIGKQFESVVREYFKTVLFKMRYVTHMEPFIKQACLIGNTHAGLIWRKEYQIRKRWQDGIVIPRRQLVWDSTRVETHDIFDVVFNPRVSFYSQDLTRIRRKVLDKNELNARKNYSNLTSIKSANEVQNSDTSKEIRHKLYGMNDGIVDKKNDVELLIFHGDIEELGYEDYMGVVANRGTLLDFKANPYWCGNPNVFSNYSDFHNELLGRGAAEPIRGLAKLIDTFSCQKADLANLIIGGFWVYENDGVIDTENLVARPFGMVEAASVNNIASLTPSADPTLAFSEINDLRFEADRSSAANMMKQGAVMPGRRSATEALQIGAGSDTRFNDIVSHLGELGIEPSLNMILQQEFQFNYGSPVLPALAWEGTYKVTFHGARTTMVRSLAIQQMQQFAAIVGNSEMLSQFVDPREYVREWAKLLHIKNNKLVRDNPMSRDFPELSNQQAAPGSEILGAFKGE